MKVQELISLLSKMDPEDEVCLEASSGDHHNSQLALEVQGVAERPVVWSEYHGARALPHGETEYERDQMEVVVSIIPKRCSWFG